MSDAWIYRETQVYESLRQDATVANLPLATTICPLLIGPGSLPDRLLPKRSLINPVTH